jgi:hypothetical protein
LIFSRRRKNRTLYRFFMRPVLPFALEFLLLAPLALGVDTPEITPLYLFLSPWLLFLLAILNLPLVAQVFQLFRMDTRVRRNHALEHATIHFLWAAGRKRIGGRATADGFRVSGEASPAEIRRAFDQVRDLIRARRRLPHVSRHCGSNRVTALGVGILMLFVVVIVSLVLRPALWICALALVGVVLAFVLLRHAAGNLIQARFFMATDFADASIRSIAKLKAEDTERSPVHYVRTSVVPMEAAGES